MSIPREAVERLKLKDGDSVNVEVGSDSVIIRPMKLRKKWTESEVLEGVTPEMVKGEICWGGPAGKEVL